MKYVGTLILLLLTLCVNSQVFNQRHDYILSGILEVESRNGTILTGNDTTCVGVLQIRCILVDDVNRIVKKCKLRYSKFTYNDRNNRRKSIQMYYIYQMYYNPKYDFKRAVNIWCSGPNYNINKGKDEYMYKVIKEIMKLNIKHANDIHRTMILNSIDSIKTIKHQTINVITQPMKTMVKITNSCDALFISLSPTLTHFPKKVDELVKDLM